MMEKRFLRRPPIRRKSIRRLYRFPPVIGRAIIRRIKDLGYRKKNSAIPRLFAEWLTPVNGCKRKMWRMEGGGVCVCDRANTALANA